MDASHGRRRHRHALACIVYIPPSDIGGCTTSILYSTIHIPRTHRRLLVVFYAIIQLPYQEMELSGSMNQPCQHATEIAMITSCRRAAATVCLSPSSPWAPKRLPPPSRRQRSSCFPRPTRSHAHRCSRLRRQHGGEQSGLVALTFDLLTLKVVSSVPILVFLGLSVFDLGPMYATERQSQTSSDKSIA